MSELGYRYVVFEGGSLDGVERMCKEPVSDGDRYERVITKEVWRYSTVKGAFLYAAEETERNQ